MVVMVWMLPWWQFLALADNNLPAQPTVVGVRILLLRPGMGQREVERALGTEKRLGVFAGTVNSFSWDYLIQPAHTLNLRYQRDSERGKDVLVEAVLKKDQKVLVQFPAPTRRPPDANKPGEKTRIEEAIRAVHDLKVPNEK